MKTETISIKTEMNYLSLFHLPSLAIGIIIGIMLTMVIAGLIQI